MMHMKRIMYRNGHAVRIASAIAFPRLISPPFHTNLPRRVIFIFAIIGVRILCCKRGRVLPVPLCG
jgi:hypothetical protein